MTDKENLNPKLDGHSPIGILLGGVDFSELMITLINAVGDTPAVVVR